jgi:hypothetical protein
MICLLLQVAGVASIFAQHLPVTERASARDFVEYWSAARLFIEGGNPYSPDELIVLQRTAGWGGAQPLIMWNPPWTLPFILPFGLVSFTTGQLLWLLFHVWLLLISAQLLWRIYSDAGQSGRISWVLALTFVPSVFVLVIGQITPLVLAGLTLFLHAERKQNPWVLGASLVVLSIKPQLLYLFWIVFLLWILHKRPRRSMFSAALLGLAALLVPVLFDAEIYSKYLALYGVAGILKPMDWPAPTLRNVMRILFGTDQTWLQVAPTVMAGAWAIYHWNKHKHQWRWHEQLPLLSGVSVATSIFAWTYDHVILIPAIMQAAAWMSRRSGAWYGYMAARVYMAINGCHFLMRFWLSEELWYFWLAPALLINYLIFRREERSLTQADMNSLGGLQKAPET